MHPYLLPTLGFGPVVMERLIDAMDESDHDRPLSAGRFTPREVVAHLADWEPIFRGRITAASESPGSPIRYFDEEQMAIDNEYSKQDIGSRIALFRQEREKTVALVTSLTATQLDHTVIHPERGELSTEDLIGMLLGHDMYHVEQLSAYL